MSKSLERRQMSVEDLVLGLMVTASRAREATNPDALIHYAIAKIVLACLIDWAKISCPGV